MGIGGSIVDHNFFEEYLGMRVESIDEVEIIRRIEQGIYDKNEYKKALNEDINVTDSSDKQLEKSNEIKRLRKKFAISRIDALVIGSSLFWPLFNILLNLTSRGDFEEVIEWFFLLYLILLAVILPGTSNVPFTVFVFVPKLTPFATATVLLNLLSPAPVIFLVNVPPIKFNVLPTFTVFVPVTAILSALVLIFVSNMRLPKPSIFFINVPSVKVKFFPAFTVFVPVIAMLSALKVTFPNMGFTSGIILTLNNGISKKLRI